MKKLTSAQLRIVDTLRREGPTEYWPLMNDWVRDSGPAKALAFTNIERTMNTLLRANVVALDEDSGMVSLVQP